MTALAHLRPGCVVCLKSGGIHMTVESGDDADKVRSCLWFDATSVLHRAAIRIEALEPVPAEVQIQVRQAILLERLDAMPMLARELIMAEAKRIYGEQRR